jgi:hypothetical protein
MKLINIVYGDETDDADILLVSDYVHDNIDQVVQNFFDWAESTNEHGYFVVDVCGNKVLSLGTDEFIKWLNDNYFQSENKEMVVAKAHTKYNPKYPTAEF